MQPLPSWVHTFANKFVPLARWTINLKAFTIPSLQLQLKLQQKTPKEWNEINIVPDPKDDDR